MAEKTWFDRKLDDHLLVRDSILVLFLVFGYGLSMRVLAGIPWAWALGSGVLFAVLFSALMEAYARRQGTSMFRYFLGGDPLE